jgi:hypothetical protein
MPDLTKAREVTHGVDDIVRGLSLWFVNYEGAVERRGLRLSGHERVISYQLSAIRFQNCS